MDKKFAPGVYRLGYGFNKSDKAFAELNVTPNKLFLDSAKTRRLGRTDLINMLHEGAVVVLVADGDLGTGQELKRLREIIAEKGATIEGPKERGEKAVKKKAGRKAHMNWTDEQVAQICGLWYGPASAEYVMQRASQIIGQEVDRHDMNYRCGPRRKKSEKKR